MAAGTTVTFIKCRCPTATSISIKPVSQNVTTVTFHLSKYFCMKQGNKNIHLLNIKYSVMMTFCDTLVNKREEIAPTTFGSQFLFLFNWFVFCSLIVSWSHLILFQSDLGSDERGASQYYEQQRKFNQTRVISCFGPISTFLGIF